MKNKLPYIFSSLVLLVPSAHIIYSLARGYLIEFVFMILFPLCAFAVSLLLASIRRLPAIRYIFPCIISVGVIFICGFIGLFAHTEYRHTSLDWYAVYSISDNKCYQADVYEYDLINIFGSESTTVIYQYNEEDFDEAVKETEDKNTFYTDIVDLNHGVDLSAEFTVEGFVFRVVNDGDDTYLDYPKEVHMIGVNRETCEIAEITFLSSDLDYIDDFVSFTEYDCGWSYIMKKHKAHRV